MSSTDLVAALLLIAGVLAAIGVGVSGVAGIVVDAPPDNEVPPTPATTGTVYTLGDTGDESLFSLTVIEASSCGVTCRDVTIELTHHGDRSVRDVVMVARVFAGRTIAAEAVVWTDRSRIGTMAAEDRTTVSRRIRLTLGVGNAVRTQNGWVTVVVTIDSNAGATTIKRQLRVL